MLNLTNQNTIRGQLKQTGQIKLNRYKIICSHNNFTYFQFSAYVAHSAPITQIPYICNTRENLMPSQITLRQNSYIAVFARTVRGLNTKRYRLHLQLQFLPDAGLPK